jgi:transglutaminase-like putative cysteine protease
VTVDEVVARATEAARRTRAAWVRFQAGPRQGWLSVALLGLALVTVGSAIEDSKWAGYSADGRSETIFLPVLFLLAELVGLALAVTRLSRVRAHLLASFVGAAILLVEAAGSVSTQPDIVARLRDLSDSFAVFVHDVFVLGGRSTETSAFLLAIGAICWTTGYFAAFNVFRRSRAMPGVTAAGLVLLVNVSITARIQYLHVIVVALASLLLLIRVNVTQQEQGWRRRHIGGQEASRLLLRGGAAFVAVSMLGAIFLAGTASSAPLSGIWRNWDDQLVGIAVTVDRFVGGVTGTTKQPGGLFGPADSITGVWVGGNEPVFDSSSSDGRAYYWLGATYDDFDGLTWYEDQLTPTEVATGDDVLAASTDDLGADAVGRKSVTLTVTSLGLGGGTLLTPEMPLSVDRDTVIKTDGQDGPLVTIDLREPIAPGQSYSVTALVPDTSADSDLTASALAAAGTDYPPELQPYLAIRPNSIGQIAYDTADQIVASLPANQRDPNHIALAMQDFFDRTGGFTYSTDVRGVCDRQSIVDCLLVHKEGYCEHFATAMTMMLRTQGIPARKVEGYLPGRLLDAATGAREVDASAAHAWVEVYFPGYGWLKYDPTPGNAENGRVPTRLDPGQTVVPPTRPDKATPPPVVNPDKEPPVPSGPDTGLLTPPAPADPGVVGLLAVLGLAILLLGVLAAARWRRIPRGAPDATYRSVARLAAWLGYAPHPSQTAYEYAGTLGDVLPGIRAELHVVAQAKVEAVYARRPPTGDALAALVHAYRRVRVGLLRLLFRRRPSQLPDAAPGRR